MSQMISPNQRITKLKNGQIHVETVNEEPTLTQQQFKDECDINNIIKRYETTGEFTHRTSKVGQYADFTQISDYQSMVNQVQYAQEAFNSLPAQVRARFKNNPGELLSFLQDPSNKDEAIKLGLIEATLPSITAPKTNDSNEQKPAVKKQKVAPPPPSDDES